MSFSKWWCNLEDGEIALQHIHAPPDLFFIHWHLQEATVDEDGFLTAVAEHPMLNDWLLAMGDLSFIRTYNGP